MAKPSQHVRLVSVDPASIAATAVEVARRNASLDTLPDDVEAITRFARDGGTPDPTELDARIGRVVRAVYGGDADHVPADLSSPLAVVILAASARRKLEGARPVPVTTSEFAARAGLDPGSVRRLVRQRHLKRRARGLIEPRSALRFLAERSPGPVEAPPVEAPPVEAAPAETPA